MVAFVAVVNRALSWVGFGSVYKAYLSVHIGGYVPANVTPWTGPQNKQAEDLSPRAGIISPAQRFHIRFIMIQHEVLQR